MRKSRENVVSGCFLLFESVSGDIFASETDLEAVLMLETDFLRCPGWEAAADVVQVMSVVGYREA